MNPVKIQNLDTAQLRMLRRLAFEFAAWVQLAALLKRQGADNTRALAFAGAFKRAIERVTA